MKSFPIFNSVWKRARGVRFPNSLQGFSLRVLALVMPGEELEYLFSCVLGGFAPHRQGCTIYLKGICN